MRKDVHCTELLVTCGFGCMLASRQQLQSGFLLLPLISSPDGRLDVLLPSRPSVPAYLANWTEALAGK